jgi:hypothetical protein
LGTFANTLRLETIPGPVPACSPDTNTKYFRAKLPINSAIESNPQSFPAHWAELEAV